MAMTAIRCVDCDAEGPLPPLATDNGWARYHDSDGTYYRCPEHRGGSHELRQHIRELETQLAELRRRHLTALDALDVDRSTVIAKRQIRAILKGR